MEFKKMVTITQYAKQKKTQMYRTDFWTLGDGEGGMFLENSIEISVLSRVISALFFIYFIINEVTHIKFY